MSVVVDVRTGTMRRLDRRAESDEAVKAEDAADAPKLARLLTRILAELAAASRRFAPRRATFVSLDVDDTGATKYRLPHHFGGAAAWSVVGWRDASAGHGLVEDSSSDSNTLVLVSYVAGTADILVEERG